LRTSCLEDVRDRVGQDETRIRFVSAILPSYARLSKSLRGVDSDALPENQLPKVILNVIRPNHQSIPLRGVGIGRAVQREAPSEGPEHPIGRKTQSIYKWFMAISSLQNCGNFRLDDLRKCILAASAVLRRA
jgi:hypothetical protein